MRWIVLWAVWALVMYVILRRSWDDAVAADQAADQMDDWRAEHGSPVRRR